LALANSGLGAVHGFAAPVGGMFPAPHGAICAAVLPHAMAVNMQALRARGLGLTRYEEIAQVLTGDPHATAEDGAQFVHELTDRFQIPPLHTYGVRSEDFAVLIEKASRSSSMRGNPITLTRDELQEILARSL